MTDALGRATRYEHDGANRLTRVTDPLAGQTDLTYDANGNLTGLTDALSHTTAYAYDNNDRAETRTDPLGHAESYHYDQNGNLAQLTDRKSQVTGYSYDALDRLSQITYADQSTITYTYDAGDRLTQIADSANGTIARQYDALDRLLQETTAEGTVTYAYDRDGRRTSMTVLGQPVVTYAYDDADRLTTITQGSAVVSLGYDAADHRTSVTYPNGIVGTTAYDAASEITGITYALNGTPVGTLTYAYDMAGRRLTVGGTWARTNLPPPLAGAVYDAANRITTWNGVTFGYDLNGNLVSDGASAYTWNPRNELIAFSGTSGAFLYDGLGRRRAKTLNGATTSFLYDGLNATQELSSASPAANLLTGLTIDDTFARVNDAETGSILIDALGSAVSQTNGSGTLQTIYTYDPYGGTSVSGAPSSSAIQFTRRENDGNGLYLFRARYYQSTAGRFISEDPIRSSHNLYIYANDNPITFDDPLGLLTVWIGIGGTFAPVLGNGATLTGGVYVTVGGGCGSGGGAFVNSGISYGGYAGGGLLGGFGPTHNFAGPGTAVDVGFGPSATIGSGGIASGLHPGYGLAFSETNTTAWGNGTCDPDRSEPWDPPPPWPLPPLPPLSPVPPINPRPTPHVGPFPRPSKSGT